MDLAGMLESIKGFLSGIVVRWIFKLAGGWLIGLGYSEASATELIGGIVLFIFGALISLVQQKKAINTPPPVVNP